MANQLDGILILSLEAEDRVPGFSGVRVICPRTSLSLALDKDLATSDQEAYSFLMPP
jgi:hypothetical protein